MERLAKPKRSFDVTSFRAVMKFHLAIERASRRLEKPGVFERRRHDDEIDSEEEDLRRRVDGRMVRLPEFRRTMRALHDDVARGLPEFLVALAAEQSRVKLAADLTLGLLVVVAIVLHAALVALFLG